MNVKTVQNADIQGWLKALAPWVIMGLGVWYFMGNADANQATSSKQLDRIEGTVTKLSETVNDLRVKVGKLETAIGNLDNPKIQRVEKAEVK